MNYNLSVRSDYNIYQYIYICLIRDEVFLILVVPFCTLTGGMTQLLYIHAQNAHLRLYFLCCINLCSMPVISMMYKCVACVLYFLCCMKVSFFLFFYDFFKFTLAERTIVTWKGKEANTY